MNFKTHLSLAGVEGWASRDRPVEKQDCFRTKQEVGRFWTAKRDAVRESVKVHCLRKGYESEECLSKKTHEFEDQGLYETTPKVQVPRDEGDLYKTAGVHETFSSAGVDGKLEEFERGKKVLAEHALDVSTKDHSPNRGQRVEKRLYFDTDESFDDDSVNLALEHALRIGPNFD